MKAEDEQNAPYAFLTSGMNGPSELEKDVDFHRVPVVFAVHT